MQLNAFQKKLLFESSLTFVLIMALLGGVWYFGNSIRTTSDNISAMRAELAMRSNALNSIAALRSEYRARGLRYLNAMYDYVPTEEQLINLRQEIMVLTSKSNLSLQYTFISETPATSAVFGSYNFRIDVSGDYDAVLAFVGTLQKFRYLSSFREFSITRTADRGMLSAKGTVYFREDTVTPSTL